MDVARTSTPPEPQHSDEAGPTLSQRVRLASLVVVALLCALGLAWQGATEDSVTVDEPSHLVAGYAVLAAGDYRLSPDHPPLGRMVMALPLLATSVSWRAEGTEAWRRGDFFSLGRTFFEEWNDGQEMVRAPRTVAIIFLFALLLVIGAVGRALFGTAGGVLALSVAAFDPALLAHGHLATMDVPFSLFALLTLLCAHRWLSQPTTARTALLALTFSASTLIKFSWIALIPALAAMMWIARRRRVPSTPSLSSRTLLKGCAAIILTTIVGIWAAYGFRFAAARGADSAVATMHVLGDFNQPLPTTSEGAWESVLHDPATAADRSGPTVPVLRAAHSLRLLPEAYLYGLAYVAKKAETRAAYLHGRFSMHGFPEYFAWAFAVKTPLPTLLLIVAGLAFSVLAWIRGAGLSPLAAGLAVFSLAYLAILTSSGLNLGYRHLIPVTVILMALTGAVFAPRAGVAVRPSLSLAVACALAWLALGTWRASPRLLGFFNEAVGGFARGHLYLAESNLDWGQDLLRLEERLRSEPKTTSVWLAQAGDPPRPRGLAVRWLLGEGSHVPTPEAIKGGLYVISATDLLGVYRPLARVTAWRDARLIDRFESMANERAAGSRSAEAPGEIDAFEALRRLRLVSRLAQREPDERIGTSLFLFRLSDDDVARATEP